MSTLRTGARTQNIQMYGRVLRRNEPRHLFGQAGRGRTVSAVHGPLIPLGLLEASDLGSSSTTSPTTSRAIASGTRVGPAPPVLHGRDQSSLRGTRLHPSALFCPPVGCSLASMTGCRAPRTRGQRVGIDRPGPPVVSGETDQLAAGAPGRPSATCQTIVRGRADAAFDRPHPGPHRRRASPDTTNGTVTPAHRSPHEIRRFDPVAQVR